ncbi:MAG: C1 family peptidase [Bacilli bacterium]
MKKVNVEENTITGESFNALNRRYMANPRNIVLRHALCKNSISSVVYDQKNEVEVLNNFSINLKTLPVANQKASGRCWIFAGLNVLREIIANKLNITKDFELSQNYIALFDKLEKANYLMCSIIDLIDSKPDDRVFMYLLSTGVGDGGQWDMFRNLVRKYGIVPKGAMEETYQSSNTRESDALLNSFIRQFAAEAQKAYKNDKSKDLSLLKDDYLDKIYGLLVNSFGVPPTKFDFEYTDKDNKYHIESGLTPISFFNEYIGDTIDEYVSIINSPTSDKPFLKTYTIDYLGNVIEGKIITHLNLPMDRVKELIIAQLKGGDVVWFGSDVAGYKDLVTGLWDDLSYDYMSAFDMNLKFDKANMLDYRASAMNHAMCITGVNLKNNVPTKWKIENSWGDERGNKGYFIMSPSWFDSYVYQAVILKKYLNDKEIAALKEKPTVLDPWDPMGTLAL